MPFVTPKLIESARVCVRPISESDLPSLLEVNSDEQVVRFLGHAPWQTMTDAEAWFARISKLQASGSALEFVIVARQTGSVIGRCGLFDFEEVNAHAALGYILGRAHWGQGYMREALTVLINCAFSEMKLRRLEAKVEAQNTASAGLLLRLGFTREGVLRERWISNGQTMDAEVYGLLRPEWSHFPSATIGRTSTVAEHVVAKPHAISFRLLAPDEFDVIRPLWEQLNQQHATYSTPFAAEIASRSFDARVRALRDKAPGDRLRIEIASTMPDGLPIAYCLTTLSAKPVGEIDSLFVLPEYRRLGIASTLIQNAMNWLREVGAVCQRVVVFHANDEAVAFYRRFGFHPRNIELELVQTENDG